MTPVSTAIVSAIDVTADLSRTTDAGLHYTGYLSVPAAGAWTFYATSDAGAHLRLHAAQIIDDDFNHNGSEVSSGTVLLDAGLHPLTLAYRTTTNAPSFDLQWEGPGTPRQAVPASALFRGILADIPLQAMDDADLANRLLEYGMGGQPHLTDGPQFQLKAAMVSHHLHVTYPRRRPGSHDLDYTFQLTNDFNDWDTLSSTEFSTSPIADQPDLEEVTMDADAGATLEPIQAGRLQMKLQ